MRFMQTESVLQTKKRSGPAKNRFSVALCTPISVFETNVILILLQIRFKCLLNADVAAICALMGFKPFFKRSLGFFLGQMGIDFKSKDAFYWVYM